MEVSNKLAEEFHTILLSHALALLLLASFTAYVYFRAKKSPLLDSYLWVVGMIALWMAAKILKTVSPRIELRWLFIVVQYFAVDSLGVCLLIFSYIYRRNKWPSKKQIGAWSMLPLASFFILVTNPLHMMFYSYFDIYKDRFGPAFYAAQSIQYAYLLIGILQLSKGFTKQSGFSGKKGLGRLFSIFVLLPILGNLYYLLFKVGVFPWIFSFPVFDFTPIAASISLMLFIVPTLAFRFFDLSPVSLCRLYDIVPQGLAFLDDRQRLYGGNETFFAVLQADGKPTTLLRLLKDAEGIDEENAQLLQDLVRNEHLQEADLSLRDGRSIKVQKQQRKNGHLMLCVSDITEISRNRLLLSKQKKELEEINGRLRDMADTTRALAIARTKLQMAQNIHDILGHSLTVVMGTAELAAGDSMEDALQKTTQIEEMLISSLSDLKNALSGKGMRWGETTLLKALRHLKNENIFVDIQTHGKAYELSGAQTEAVYRLCQEAVTNAIRHGQANTIYLILRFQPQEVEVFAIDNGTGCLHIEKSYGLLGMEARIKKQSGSICFASDGESGFTIRAVLPKQAYD